MGIIAAPTTRFRRNAGAACLIFCVVNWAWTCYPGGWAVTVHSLDERWAFSVPVTYGVPNRRLFVTGVYSQDGVLCVAAMMPAWPRPPGGMVCVRNTAAAAAARTGGHRRPRRFPHRTRGVGSVAVRPRSPGPDCLLGIRLVLGRRSDGRPYPRRGGAVVVPDDHFHLGTDQTIPEPRPVVRGAGTRSVRLTRGRLARPPSPARHLPRLRVRPAGLAGPVPGVRQAHRHPARPAVGRATVEPGSAQGPGRA